MIYSQIHGFKVLGDWLDDWEIVPEISPKSTVC